MQKALHLPSSYLTRIRGVGLLSDERVVSLFTPQDGVVTEPTRGGRLLVTTNQRIIAFSDSIDDLETMLYPIEDLSGVTVKNGPPNALSLWQGLMMIAAGLIVYFAVSYWLTGKIDGPNLPLINIDLGPFVVLVGILAGGWVAWKHFFSEDGGVVNFQGNSWSFFFPYQGDHARDDVYPLIDHIFAARNARAHPHSPGAAGEG